MAKKESLCLNFLRSVHKTNQCSLTQKCKACGYKHHTLLHFGSKTSRNDDDNEVIASQEEPSTEAVKSNNSQVIVIQLHHSIAKSLHNMLLFTTLIKGHGPPGQSLCRVLLDSGSQSHFITSSFTNRLGLKK